MDMDDSKILPPPKRGNVMRALVTPRNFPKIPRSYADQNSGKQGIFDGLHSGLSKLSESQTQPYIYKVHNHLSNINDKAYEPHIVAIGPYHRGKDNLQMMEDHKLRYLKSLLHRKNQNVELYISAIGELEEHARSCYSERISLDASEFIQMLVLDGCFIIELLLKSCMEGSSCEKDLIFQMDWIRDSLQRDLILFENQIPFFVLCKLFDLIEETPNQHSTLIALIQSFFLSLYPSRRSREKWESWVNDAVAEAAYWDLGEIKHLLHLMHDSWRSSVQTGADADVKKEDDPVCIQSLCCLKKPSTSEREFRFNIPSATELTKANVSFSKRKPDDNSKGKLPYVNLFQIEFQKGVLVMPQLKFSDDTEPFFRNLIAYEQYFPDHKRGNFITDYVIFMDCLINTSKDVEILSKSKIIDNYLGDNEVLVGIFNKLNDSVLYSEKCMYSGIVDRVNEHYERPWNHAMAVLRRDYFNSPWAYITFFSAVLLLLLTAAQAVCSVLQLYSK